MGLYQEEYRRKCCTAEAIAERIESGAVCASGTCLSVFHYAGTGGGLAEWDADGDRTSSDHVGFSIAFFDDTLQGKYSAVSWFSTAYGRAAFEKGCADVMPVYYRDVPGQYRKFIDLDVFYATVSPMDRHGYFSFGTTAAECQALAEQAKHIFLEVNPNMPRTFGEQQIHISQVEALCETDVPLQEAAPAEIDEISRCIGGRIAEEVPNGATIQLGIGAIPAAVGLCLRDKRDLGIHTELFSDAMVELIECGAVTNQRKTLHKGKSVTTLAYGTRRVYDYLNDNTGVAFYPVDYVNDPRVIAQNDNFISVNACLEVDLWGQVAATFRAQAARWILCAVPGSPGAENLLSPCRPPQKTVRSVGFGQVYHPTLLSPPAKTMWITSLRNTALHGCAALQQGHGRKR